MYKPFLYFFLLAASCLKAQVNNGKVTLQKATQITDRSLRSFFGNQLMGKFIRLNAKQSSIRHGKDDSLYEDYASSAMLVYDLLYKGDTATQVFVFLNDSLHIINGEMAEALDLQYWLGWKYALADSFHFNYDRIKAFVRSHQDIDTAHKYISIGYTTLPQELQRKGKFFLRTKFYWKIWIRDYEATDKYDYKRKGDREIRIDVDTGEVFYDEITFPRNYQ